MRTKTIKNTKTLQRLAKKNKFSTKNIIKRILKKLVNNLNYSNFIIKKVLINKKKYKKSEAVEICYNKLANDELVLNEEFEKEREKLIDMCFDDIQVTKINSVFKNIGIINL